MKLGPRDAMTAVRDRARFRCASSETNLDGPNRIQRRRSRRKAITNGDSRNQTVNTRKRIMEESKVPELRLPELRNRCLRPAGCRISFFQKHLTRDPKQTV